MSDFYPTLPDQPPEDSWPFEVELQKPLHPPTEFGTGAPSGRRELDFSRGIHLDINFPDPHGLLETAYADFHDFCESISLKDTGALPISLIKSKTGTREEYEITVASSGITIAAGDTEGIRRGLIQLEDRILARGNYCLSFGVTRRRPLIRTRLSRCFYGPINRPPKCRDELMEEADYYPQGYLNRLAHSGVNALWLTIRFRDICRSNIIPELSADSSRRLEKLRRIVQQCARYGIKIYPFCIEPAALPTDSPVLQSHPELKGADAFGKRSLFCTSSETGKAYLEDAARTLFSEVPGLGGLICIPVGERFTHCYSGRLSINCPRCSSRKPWEVLADTLTSLERGMHAVDSEAELIAWPYSQLVVWGPEATVEAAGNMPSSVILQHNFETGGRVKQLGKWRPLWDYWLSWVGPSRIFADCAEAANANNTRIFAKLQTSCSHEVATTQYVPVPGILYRKYKKMHRLGISGVMQGWYFGNYPSLMTKASELLSFAPFPKTEKEFLQNLAAPVWGRHTAQIVKAWQHFADGYTQFPGAQIFSYYGPMHDGVVWPLYLVPQHLPLAPTWRVVHPLSGDQVGECISPAFNFHEVLMLCKALRDHWRQGTAILDELEVKHGLSQECRREINVATALGVQFDSGYNILLFYLLRDRLAQAKDPAEQNMLLGKLKALVLEEIDNSTKMLKLSEENRTLGFHSEAEAYKYFPELLSWRINQLRELLEEEFAQVTTQVGRYPMPAFENYIGEGTSIQSYICCQTEKGRKLVQNPFASDWEKFASTECRYWAAPFPSEATEPFPFNSTLYPVANVQRERSGILWRAAFDDKAIYFCLAWQAEAITSNVESGVDDDEIRITLEPERLGPSIATVIKKSNSSRATIGSQTLKVCMDTVEDQTRLTVGVPWHVLGMKFQSMQYPIRMRVNVSYFSSPIIDPLCFTGEPLLNSWAQTRRTMPRNLFGYTDPGTYGWLVFENDSGRKL